MTCSSGTAFCPALQFMGKEVSHVAGRLSHRLPDLEPEAEAVASQKRRTAPLRLLGGALSYISGFSWRGAAQTDVSSPMADACQANRGWLIEHKICRGQCEQCRAVLGRRSRRVLNRRSLPRRGHQQRDFSQPANSETRKWPTSQRSLSSTTPGLAHPGKPSHPGPSKKSLPTGYHGHLAPQPAQNDSEKPNAASCSTPKTLSLKSTSTVLHAATPNPKPKTSFKTPSSPPKSPPSPKQSSPQTPSKHHRTTAPQPPRN